MGTKGRFAVVGLFMTRFSLRNRRAAHLLPSTALICALIISGCGDEAPTVSPASTVPATAAVSTIASTDPVVTSVPAATGSTNGSEGGWVDGSPRDADETFAAASGGDGAASDGSALSETVAPDAALAPSVERAATGSADTSAAAAKPGDAGRVDADAVEAEPVEDRPVDDVAEREAPIVAESDVVGGDVGGVVAEEPGITREEQLAQVGLSAGSTDDNERFAEYLTYVERFAATGIEVVRADVSGRQIVRVTDATGRPVHGAAVEVVVGEQVVDTLRTYADGTTIVHPRFYDAFEPPSLRVTDGRVTAGAVGGFGDDPLRIRLSWAVERPERPKLDVMFVLDATGSMGDEIDRLKATINDAAQRIGAHTSNPDLRIGMTVYRDRGDAYLTRTYDFTSDVAAFRSALSDVVAGGGGDTPEAMDVAMADALAKPSWRGDDTVKLVFLVADAATHLEEQEDISYVESARTAARRGITVFPIASSGTDDQAEYMFRQLAQITSGRFVFLDYGAEGGGAATGASTDIAPGSYSTLPLDQLVVRLIHDELDALAR